MYNFFETETKQIVCILGFDLHALYYYYYFAGKIIDLSKTNIESSSYHEQYNLMINGE